MDKHKVVLVEDYQEFCTKTPKRAKLIFAEERDFELIGQLCQEFKLGSPIKNPEDLSLIQNMRKNVVVVTTDNSVLMRGTNFRGKEGIDLLIAAPLPNDRAYIQALGRVQRAGDEGARYRLKNVAEVDNGKRVDLLSKLVHRT